MKRNDPEDNPRIPLDIEEEIKTAFELFDSDGSGMIDPLLMLQTFEKLGLHKTKPSIYACIQSMCTKGKNDDKLNYDKFMEYTYAYYSDRYTREGLKNIFQLFDEDNIGVITRESFRKFAATIDIFLNREDLDEVFRKASTDNKVISYEDFEFFMKKTDGK
ncbi:ef hand family protein [Stylonychia lemnae]|uniref:Calmodulin n=1 Tax=Stylonychia lemnae TaxID=5949 RepID=A0A078A5Z2_STYLE|nr:ef hand family protein [Stylonychia lemnae]|eukprot:CDW76975.1 ef hand family protein [Stylonychia lemnae]